MKYYCVNCEENEVLEEGNICVDCIEWERKVREGDLTDDERLYLIEQEAEGFYQAYKNM